MLFAAHCGANRRGAGDDGQGNGAFGGKRVREACSAATAKLKAIAETAIPSTSRILHLLDAGRALLLHR